jgi:hypothetical protein
MISNPRPSLLSCSYLKQASLLLPPSSSSIFNSMTSSPNMTFFVLFLLVPLAIAQSVSLTSSTASGSAPTSSSPPYSITALPQVVSQPSCIFNCLIPIGLADPSGCDDVTNDCACLSAPADVLDVLTGCVETVCKSSTSAYAAVVTSLYESYCKSIYGTAVFTSAFSAEAAAAASSSSSESIASIESASSASAATASSARMATSSSTPSATAKSESTLWSPSL